MSAVHYEMSKPTCPHCDHVFTTDDMTDAKVDLWGLAPDEGREEIECPSCSAKFFVQGGYKPNYTTAIDEDDL